MNGRRILIITNRVPYPLNDGGNLATHAMIEGYHKAGWVVHVLAMNTSRHQVPDEQLAELYPGIDGFSTVMVDNKVSTIRILRNFLFSNQPNHAARFFTPAFRWKVIEVIREFKPEIVQLESIFLASYIPFIHKLDRSIRIAIRLHNIEYQVWERLATETKNALKRYYLHNLSTRIKRFEEKAWQDADLLIPITTTDAEVVKKTGIKTKMVVAPFGIDTIQVTTSRNEQWVGYHIGAMDWLPNAEAMNWFLTDIWPDVHKEIPSFRFYFAGRHTPEPFMKMQIEGVTCEGEVPDANVFIADKKILIVPLRSGGGIRVKILEAMAAGKVIISTRIGMQGIDAIGGTHYRLSDTKDEFVAAIKWCLENKDKAQLLAENARQLAITKYNRDVIMQHVIKDVENMLRN
jgi:polysaccharide biosynthesis protein PslH